MDYTAVLLISHSDLSSPSALTLPFLFLSFPLPPPSLPHSVAISLTLLNHLKWADEQEQEQEFRLVENVSAKWRKFGTYLGLKSNQLDAWDRQYRGDANECWNKVCVCVCVCVTPFLMLHHEFNMCIQVMDDWLTRGGSCGYPATWEGLYSLLNDLGFRNISRNMQRAVAGFCAQ